MHLRQQNTWNPLFKFRVILWRSFSVDRKEMVSVRASLNSLLRIWNSKWNNYIIIFNAPWLIIIMVFKYFGKGINNGIRSLGSLVCHNPLLRDHSLWHGGGLYSRGGAQQEGTKLQHLSIPARDRNKIDNRNRLTSCVFVLLCVLLTAFQHSAGCGPYLLGSLAAGAWLHLRHTQNRRLHNL